ncbi:MAG: GNAT family protein [Anaerolineae bacterium]
MSMSLIPVTLTGRWVQLAPLSIDHAEDLWTVAEDEEIWRYMLYDTPHSLQEMRAIVQDALDRQAHGEVLAFTQIDRASGRAIGQTRYLDISVKDRHVEIGSTWIGRAYWRTPINTESKYLLLQHAFEELGCIRVQLKTDLRNTRSQKAIERLGAVREGVLRKNMIVRDAYARSSVYFSIVDDEWPAIKARLKNFMNAPASPPSA